MDSGKRCENANVDMNTLMHFQKTEVFENALVWMGPQKTERKSIPCTVDFFSLGFQRNHSRCQTLKVD